MREILVCPCGKSIVWGNPPPACVACDDCGFRLTGERPVPHEFASKVNEDGTITHKICVHCGHEELIQSV